MKRYTVTVNGKVYDVTVEENTNGAAPAAAPVQSAAPAPVQTAAPSAPAAGTKVSAPMPGTVLKMNVSVGDSVKRGDVLCVLEAMKMENEITAPADGKITYAVAKGAPVKTGDTLAAIQ